jgi:hypothetical protein
VDVSIEWAVIVCVLVWVELRFVAVATIAIAKVNPSKAARAVEGGQATMQTQSARIRIEFDVAK